ncbi:MAG: enoyl-CoA hydratase/isomerase family protein [Oligoflexia bacterium]|nr:enoyl-CoA hydratase/isomerase family protein [Oligoflexia bacterium]
MTENNSVAPTVRLERLESGVCVLRLGAPEERVVTITPQRIQALVAVLKELRAQRPPGLIITGPSLEMFTAGAEISLIRDVRDPEIGKRLAREGQAAFDALADLPFPTLAAIGGPCVGGGCELALACTYRIISDAKTSLIGLPEVKLGILPGFGGTQRLPRLIGLPRALDVILAGKTLRPKQALKSGLVDAIVSPEQLLAKAEAVLVGREKLSAPRLTLQERFLTFTSFGRNLVRRNASAKISKETKGFYPAPSAALESCLFGLQAGITKGLENEASELGRLIVTPESKSLVRLFFLTEAAKGIGRSARRSVEHVHALVIGAGVMGAGIAGTLAKNDCAVILKDSAEPALQRGMDHIRKQLEKQRSLSEQERSFILNRIEATTRESINTGNVTIVIEAIVENMEVKRKVLAEIAALVPAEAIIATNTSSLSVSEIASTIPHPERVIGMHFFNPVEKMPLIEIIHGTQSSDRAIATVAALSAKLGKFPIVVSDVPGFLVNRILTPYLNEAAFMLNEGFSIDAIDKAALRFGMPMGPIRLLDEIGLDVAAHVLEIMVKGYGERMHGPNLLPKLVAAKRLGRKCGAGFYDFQGDNAVPHSGIRSLLNIQAPVKSADEKVIQDRLILSLLNEGVRCLDEGVAGAPGKDAAQQIDLGTVMGMGFPPFRGGLLHYAESLGAREVLARLKQLSTTAGARFQPCQGIVDRAERGIAFSAAVKG